MPFQEVWVLSHRSSVFGSQWIRLQPGQALRAMKSRYASDKVRYTTRHTPKVFP